jgi:hypothetical protein
MTNLLKKLPAVVSQEDQASRRAGKVQVRKVAAVRMKNNFTMIPVNQL